MQSSFSGAPEQLYVRQLLAEAHRLEYDEALRTSVRACDPGVCDAAATPTQTQTQPNSAARREGEPAEMPEWMHPANRSYAAQGVEQDCTVC